MKYFSILILFFSIQAGAEGMVCKSTCDNITKEQSDCVVRKRCNPELKKLIKKNKDLEDRIKELEQQLDDAETHIAILDTENRLERELREMRFGETVDNTRKNRINLFVGEAPSGNIKGSASKVITERKGVTSLQYLRDVSERVNLGVQVQTNKSLQIGIGLNF